MPQPAKTLCKGPELQTVAWNRMVLVITRNNLLQPRTNGGDRLMHACTQFCPDQAQFCLHPLFRRFPPDDEGGGRSGPAAVMREAEKCERLWLPFTPLLLVLNGMPPKFDEPCLFRVKFQTELGQVQTLVSISCSPFKILNGFRAFLLKCDWRLSIPLSSPAACLPRLA